MLNVEFCSMLKWKRVGNMVKFVRNKKIFK